MSMQLRQRLSLRPETISDFAIAAEQKYREGIIVAKAGHPGAGIYFFGYTAEMLLKAACFRFDGASPSDRVAPRLAPARNWLASHPWSVNPEGYHSLEFWTTYLRARRVSQGRALDRNLDGQLLHRARRRYLVWWVEMRYRSDRATPEEVRRVFNDVTWLREHFVSLWR
jgi:hypothetical protein